MKPIPHTPQPPTHPSPRYEIKIPLPAPMLYEVEAWVRLHPAHWRVAYPPRQVNNVYFDSANLAGLNANLGGIADRAKLRLRWYGTDLAHARGANLELKRKQGMAGWKDIVAVEGEFDLEAMTWPVMCAALRDTSDLQARGWLDHFAYPVLVNHYWRAYYVTPDDVVRLTIDTALRAYDQRVSVRPNLRRAMSLDARGVVELKAAMQPEAVRQLSDALMRFPVRVDRFSKYVQGMLAAPDF